jgi:hypothetical protein
MMLRAVRYIDYLLIAVLVVGVLTACGNKNAGSNLLAIPVGGSEVIDHAEYNQKLSAVDNKDEIADNIYQLLSRVWVQPKARSSAMTVRKIDSAETDRYKATIIFDNIPDDDSVSGYRYDLILLKSADGLLQITEARQSWRCWDDRGHTDFSIEPCA